MAKRHGTGRRATVNGPDSLNPSRQARKVEAADKLVEAVEAAIEPVHPTTSPEVTASEDAVTEAVKASAVKAVRELGFRPVYKAERFGPEGLITGYQLRDIVTQVRAWQSGRGYTVTTRSGNVFLTSSPSLVERNGRPLIGCVIEALVLITTQRGEDGMTRYTNNATFVNVVRMPED